MFPAVRCFVRRNRDVFVNCMITGARDIIDVITSALGKRNVHLGPIVSDPSMGGLAELATLLVNEKIGVFFSFPDPTCLSAAENVDKTALHRLINVHNVPHATNPTTADMIVVELRKVVQGESSCMQSMTHKLLKMSPAVDEYNKRQAELIQNMQRRSGGSSSRTDEEAKTEKRAPKKTGLGAITESILEAEDSIVLHE